MSEFPTWRKRLFIAGIVITLLGPAYFVVGLNVCSHAFRLDIAVGRFILSGIVLSVFALICGICGKGPHRWTLIVGSCVEAILWWFMAVGA
jgi:hypothetical protein